MLVIGNSDSVPVPIRLHKLWLKMSTTTHTRGKWKKNLKCKLRRPSKAKWLAELPVICPYAFHLFLLLVNFNTVFFIWWVHYFFLLFWNKLGIWWRKNRESVVIRTASLVVELGLPQAVCLFKNKNMKLYVQCVDLCYVFTSFGTPLQGINWWK